MKIHSIFWVLNKNKGFGVQRMQLARQVCYAAQYIYESGNSYQSYMGFENNLFTYFKDTQIYFDQTGQLV